MAKEHGCAVIGMMHGYNNGMLKFCNALIDQNMKKGFIWRNSFFKSDIYMSAISKGNILRLHFLHKKLTKYALEFKINLILQGKRMCVHGNKDDCFS